MGACGDKESTVKERRTQMSSFCIAEGLVNLRGGRGKNNRGPKITKTTDGSRGKERELNEWFVPH